MSAAGLANALGGPIQNKIGAVTLSAGTFAEQDLTGAGVLPIGVYEIVADIDVIYAQGATGLAAPVLATVGAPGSSTAIGQLLPAKTPKRITVTGAADKFIRGTAAGAGVLRWHCLNQNQPPT